MTLYSVILFFHLLGALALFAALGLEWRLLRYMELAKSVDELRVLAGAGGVLPGLNGFAAAFILLPAFYLTTRMKAWPQGWISIALLGTLIIAGLGMAITGPRTRALRKVCAEPKASWSEELQRAARQPLLRTSFRLRLALGLAIVFLMASKSGYGVSIAVAGIALALAFVFSLSRNKTGQKRDYA